MKKHFLKSFALLAMLFSAITMSAASGVDWSSLTWVGASSDKYKVSTADGLNVINVQHPGFASESGIYVEAPSAISACSVNGAIQGAGVVMYLSSFELKETKVTITHAQGTITFWVYYEDGIDWSSLTWVGASSDKYKVSTADGLNVINVQHPGFASESGIYVEAPSAISACSVNGAVQGAGVVMYLSSFIYQETKVTITHAQGVITFWVYYADGIEGQDLGSNEEDESGWGSVNWVTGSNNKYKVSHDCLQDVVSVQQPGWADEPGIYVVAPGTIESCSVNGAIQGGGMVIYLSNFTAKETEVTIDYAGGSCTFVVYYADGAELDPSAPVVTTLTATPASNLCKVGENIAITVVAKDQNGMTMADAGTIEYTISPADAGTIVDNVFTPTKAGLVTITASVGSIQAEPVEVYAYAGDNLALSTNIVTDNKIIAQSDFAPNGTDAWNAVDGNEGSVWQGSATNGGAGDDAARTYDSWFVIDLGAHYNLNLVTITFEGACSQNYTVAVSSDYINWNTAYTHNGSAGVNGRTDNLFGNNLNNATNVRFVRFWSTKAATQWGVKVFEFKVYGTKVADKVVGTNNPAMQSATLKSTTPTSATLTLSATDADNTGIVKYHVKDEANGLDKIVTSLTNDFLVKGLKDNTTYTLVVAAIDVDGNESAPFTMESFTTAADLTKPTTSAPVPTRDAEDVLAFYSDAYTPVINLWGKNQWTGVNFSENNIAGNNYLHYAGNITNLGWEFGVNAGANVEGISSGVDCSAMEYLHIDIWGFENGTIRVIPVWGGTDLVNNKGLNTNADYYAEVQINAGEWNSVDIPLATGFQPESRKHDFTSIFQFKFAECNNTVAIDNVYFWKSAGTLPVESVTLDKTTATIEVDEALQLKATVLPTDAANKNVVWTSSNTSVATVSPEGVVTGLTIGTTTITATSEENGEIKATCEITVEPITVKTWWGGPVALTLAGQEHYVLYSFTRNENKTITYTVIFDQGNLDIVKQINLSDVWNGLQWMDAENTTASWTGETTHNKNEKILGYFYFGGPRIDFDTEAKAYIVGSSNERPSTAVQSVILNKTSSDLLVDETLQLTATVNPGYAANKNVTWVSSNPAVAEVDNSGLVTAKSAGNATITVTTADGGKTATCIVNVVAALTDATYHANSFFIENGRYVGINYSVTRTADRKLHYEATINGNVVGLVVEFNDGNWRNMTYDEDSKSYSYTTDDTYSEGTTVNHFFYVKFAGGAYQVNAYHPVGSTNSPVLTMVGINDQEDNQSTRLAQYTSPVDVVLARSFSPDYWQTITLPFTLNAAQITEIFGAGTQVLKLAKAGVAPDQAMELGFTTVTGIQASTPYLIMPAQTVGAGTIVRNVTLNTNAQTVKVSNVTMHPLLDKVTYNYTTDDVLFFVGSDNYLHYQANDNTILGLRAYFTFEGITKYEQAAQVRARVVFNENETTGVDNLITTDAPIKVIENGQLIIIRDGVKYNLQGQKL